MRFSIQLPIQERGPRIVAQSSLGDSNYPIGSQASTAHQTSSELDKQIIIRLWMLYGTIFGYVLVCFG